MQQRLDRVHRSRIASSEFFARIAIAIGAQDHLASLGLNGFKAASKRVACCNLGSDVAAVGHTLEPVGIILVSSRRRT